MREGVFTCVHLAEMYDRAKLKYELRNHGTEQDFEQELIEYALNRMWALERDNTAKGQGEPAKRVYHSRNVRAQSTLEKIKAQRANKGEP